MDVPPSRYKVVEKGRRLVVVDTLTGREAAHNPAPRAHPQPARRERPRTREAAPLPAETGASRPGVITTERWYDNRAPRRVVLGDNGAFLGFLAIMAVAATVLLMAMFGWPALIVAGVLLLNASKPIRAGFTGWFDSLEQA